MESISNKGAPKVGQPAAPATVSASAPAAKTKKSAPADSIGRSTSAPVFTAQTEKTASDETAKVGAALKDLAKADAPVPGESIIRWLLENNFTSKGQTRVVQVPNVTLSASGVRAPFIHVTGLTQLSEINNQQPFEPKSKVTRDEFDQALLVSTLHRLNELQAAVGIDNAKLWVAARNNGVIRAKANGTSDLNAFYIPTSNDLTFGTNNGKWHLASDDDVTEHETGHNRLDKQNPDMFGGHGGGFHEGWSDFCSALSHRNGNLSEDFGEALGTPGEPLRNLVNDKTLTEAGEEVHDQGEVYGGAAWSTTLVLAEKLGSLEAACDALQHVALKTGFYLTKSSPTSADLVTGWLKCARDSLPGVLDAKQVDAYCDAVRLEAIKRGMINATWKEPARASTNAKAKQLQRALGTPTSSSVDKTRKAIYDVLGKRADAEMLSVSDLAWKNPVTGLESQKQIFQLRAINRETGKKYLVKDGYLSVIASGEDVVAFRGGGRRILEKGESYTFDFSPIENVEECLTRARQAIEKYIKSNELNNHQALKRALLENKAHFFADDGLQVDEVMYGGKLCLQITSDAGEFVYDHRTDKVTAHRLAFVDYFENRVAAKAAKAKN